MTSPVTTAPPPSDPTTTEEPVAPRPLPILGTTGLKRAAGYVQEEYHPKLQGDKALKIYEEMSTTPVIGAALLAVDLLMRQVSWHFAPPDADADAEADPRLEFLTHSLNHMSRPWVDVLSEILSMVAFGWSYHEILYEQRPDGSIGWRDLAIRAQVSRFRWDFNPDGSICGMWQIAAPDYRQVFLPIEKCLLFRPAAHKNNPEGVSALRRAYRAWYLSKRIEELEGIGIERDLAGLPVAWVPNEWMSGTATAEQQQSLAYFKKMVTGIRRDEQEGVVMPLLYDDKGNKLFDLTLLSAGARRQVDMSPSLQRYYAQMAMTVLADFLMIGHEKVGSWSLVSSKTQLFSVALGAWLDTVAETINRHAVPRLLALNGMDTEDAPRLVHGDIETPDLAEVGAYIKNLTSAGMALFPDLKAENKLRSYAGLDPMTEAQHADAQTRLQEQQDAERQAALELTQAKQKDTPPSQE